MIAAIHAGWKGAFKGIISAVIKYFIKNGSESKNLIAAIGPCISQKHYEVREDFKSKFFKQNRANKIFFKNIFNLHRFLIASTI